ncbi:MAG: hypothetical protein AAF960_04840 [Bacteroidota bacterium]
MNVVKSKVAALALFLITLTVQTVFAQREARFKGRAVGISEQVLEKLDLSDDQKIELEALKNGFKTKMQTIRNTEFETTEDKRAAVKRLREEQKSAFETILTEQQQSQLATIRANQKEERKANREELKTALENYRTANVRPVLLAQRAKLETQISEEDRATLAELRPIFATKKAERKAARMEGKKEKRPSEVKGTDEDRKTLKGLVEKYKANIESLLAEIAPQQQKWRAEQKAIIDANRPEGSKNRRPKKDRKEKSERQVIKKGAFLLLDPNEK